jgi:hypothetical protein
LCNINYQQREPTVIFEDNTVAIKWSSGSSRRAKQIDLKVYFVREIVSMIDVHCHRKRHNKSQCWAHMRATG